MSFVGSNILAGASGQGGGYEIERSLRFNSADSAYLNKTPSSAGNRKTWTWAGWVKRSVLGTRQQLFAAPSSNTYIEWQNDALQIEEYSGSLVYKLALTAVQRDTSAWYHILVALDTTQATASNRIKIYINGVEQTAFSSASYPSQDHDSGINGAVLHKIGAFPGSGDGGNFYYLNGYLADVHFIDGQALAPTDFGETDDNGVWQPKEFDGTYGWFNQSQTWSSLWTGTANYGSFANVHNGVISTANYMQSYSGATFTLPSALPVTSLRLYCQVYGTGGTVLVNGVDVTSQFQSSGIAQANITGVSSLSTINITGTDGNNLIGLYAIELNGKYLIDSGITGIADNSFHLPFTDNSSNAALGTDTSGNSNTWTVNNLTAVGSAKPITHLTYTGGSVGAGAYNAAIGNVDTLGSYSGNTWTATNSGWTFTWDFGNTAQSFSLTNWSVGSYSDQTWYLSNDPSFASAVAGPNGGTIANGTHSLVVSGTRYRYCRVQNAPSATYSLLGTSVTTSPGIDSLVDTPTNGTQTDTGAGGEVVGNYATWNPLSSSGVTLSNGNLDATNSNSATKVASSTIVPTAKCYWEVTVETPMTGAIGGVHGVNAQGGRPDQSGGAGIYLAGSGSGGGTYVNGTKTAADYSASAGDIIGFAFDPSTRGLTITRNGSSVGTLTAPNTDNLQPVSALNQNLAINVNFGQRAFAYTAPSGYKSLNTANLPEPTIADGSKYFDTKLYTGNGSAQAISGYSFSPDFVWGKRRTVGNSFWLFNTISGALQRLRSDTTGAEQNQSNTLTSFDSNGFSVGSQGALNQSGNSFVAWAWDAGSSNTTIAAGSLNSSSYDQSQTWSTYGSPSSGGYQSGLGIARGFNGDLTNQVEGNTSNAYFSIPFSTTVTAGSTGYSSYASNSGSETGRMKLYNGSTLVDNIISPAGATFSYGTYSGPITEIRISRDSRQFEFSAVKVNGKILVDSGVSVPNVPSIASTVRAQPSAGFSIVSYTGTGSTSTFGHGLNATPELVIVKSRSNSQNWAVQHSALGPTYYGYLQSTNAFSTSSGSPFWNDTAPTSSVVTVGSDNDTNASGYTYIAYCFAPVAGYSAMGSYVGNGSNDGVFVHTGFKVNFLITKSSSASGDWLIWDATRQPTNVNSKTLGADTSSAENAAGYDVDLLSNGFKWRQYGSSANGSGVTYIYLAFAENPFKTARAR